jgi:hypothetical protein
MKRLRYVFLFLIVAMPLFGQDMGNIVFITELSNRKEATMADAVKLFVLTLNKKSGSFAADLQVLKKENILGDSGYTENTPLRRGALASMAARYLKLGDSFMYSVIGTGRYAVTVCVAHQIMPPAVGEWDVLSGGELIEIMSLVGERAGGAK